MLALLIAPLAALAVRALGDPGGVAALSSRLVLDAISLSLGTTAASALIILIFGTPVAYILACYRFPLKRLFSLLIELPIVLPPVVAGLALLMTFGRRGLLGPPLEALGITLPFSTAAVIIAQTFVAAPFYIRAAQMQFQGIPQGLLEAASIDGADGWRAFWHVMLPLSLRGLLAGLMLSWARALGEFGATILFAGNLQGRTQTMPLLVYGALERNLGAALWAALVLVAVALGVLMAVRWLSRTVDDGGESRPASF